VEQHLDEMAKQYQGKVGVIALDVSFGETAEGVAEFASKKGLTLPIALDSDGTTADIFGTRVTTTTVIIDGDGVLRYCGQFGDKENAFAQDALEEVLGGEEVTVKKTRHKG
jgi:peroxiredoxin